MRHVFVTLATSATALVATAAPNANAVPPYAVTGTGFMAPAFSVTPAPHSFWFSGTATDPLGVTYACTFSGTADGSMSGAAGTASGDCGGVLYPACVTTLSVAQWDLACAAGGVGSFVLTFDSSFSTFQATGTFV